MKRIVIYCLVFFTCFTYAQKKNGTVYSEHQGIDIVEAMVAAFVAGDTAKVSSYLAEDFRSFNGNSTNPNATGGSKKGYVNSVLFWQKNVDYFSLTRQNGAYPDAIEYKDGQIWVHTWDIMKGVHNGTGVKLNMPVHRSYLLDKDLKIKVLINYINEDVYSDVGRGFNPRSNGAIYDQHENINTVRKMIAAVENNDLDKAYSFFDEKARVRNVNMPPGETVSLEEDRAGFEEMTSQFEIISFDVVGYPDYIHYEVNDSRVVQSWWNVRMVRKSDNKMLTIPLMIIHDFNEDGKITRASEYFSAKLMEQ